MAKAKGCPNVACEMNAKKKLFNKKDGYCSKCGTKLEYVCNSRNCYTFLDENSDEKCLKCQAKIKDLKDNFKDVRNKVVGGVVAVGGFALTIGKKAYDFTKNNL